MRHMPSDEYDYYSSDEATAATATSVSTAPPPRSRFERKEEPASRGRGGGGAERGRPGAGDRKSSSQPSKPRPAQSRDRPQGKSQAPLFRARSPSPLARRTGRGASAASLMADLWDAAGTDQRGSMREVLRTARELGIRLPPADSDTMRDALGERRCIDPHRHAIQPRLVVSLSHVCSPLCIAARQGNLDAVHVLLAAGRTPGAFALHSAAAGGSGPVVEALLEAGAKVDALDSLGLSPIFHARTVDAAVALARAGADLGRRSATGTPLLGYFIGRESLDIFRALVAEGADVQQSTYAGGATLLHRAVGQRNYELIEELVGEHKLDPLLASDTGAVPLVLIAAWAHPIIDTVETQHNAELRERMRAIFDRLILSSLTHPLQPAGHTADGTPLEVPFVVRLAEQSPGAVAPVLDLIGRRQTMMSHSFAVFRFGCKTQAGHDFLTSASGRDMVLETLESDDSVILQTDQIQAMINAFWSHFVRRRVLFVFLVNLLAVVSLTVVANLGVSARSGAAAGLFPLFGFGTAAATIAVILLELFDARYLGMGRISLLGRWSVPLPKYLHDAWNWFDIVAHVVVLVVTVPRIASGGDFTWSDTTRHILAVVLLYFWSKVLEFGKSFRPSAILALMVTRMLVTVAKFLVVVIIFLLAFGNAFFLTLSAAPEDVEGFGTLAATCVTLYRLFVLGDFDFEAVNSGDRWPAFVFFLAFTVSGTILLLNLLIAIVTNAYEDVRSGSEHEFVRLRAELVAKIVRMNTSMHPLSAMDRCLHPTLSRGGEHKGKTRWGAVVDKALFRKEKGIEGVRVVPPLSDDKFLASRPLVGVTEVRYPGKTVRDRSDVMVRVEDGILRLGSTLDAVRTTMEKMQDRLESVESELERMRARETAPPSLHRSHSARSGDETTAGGETSSSASGSSDTDW